MNIIETHNLTRRYWKTEAVSGLDLALPEGSITALLGPNGAGKTTTIKLLMNLILPSAGEARVLGVDSRKLGPAEFARIGYVSENQQLPLWMTVRQLLDYCRPFYSTWDRALGKITARAIRPAAGAQAEASFTWNVDESGVAFLSLAYRPKLLVLDEPFQRVGSAPCATSLYEV